jgi:hypothetical protein
MSYRSDVREMMCQTLHLLDYMDDNFAVWSRGDSPLAPEVRLIQQKSLMIRQAIDQVAREPESPSRTPDTPPSHAEAHVPGPPSVPGGTCSTGGIW